MTDRIGQQLGNYRLTRLLGQGGFAEVYLGVHVHLGIQAAIKLLHAPLALASEVEKFRVEAQTIVTLQHPNIVRILDFGVEAGTPYLVMDYAPNGSLRQRLPADTPLPAATILPYVMQVAGALQYAHEQKVVHRDVKPENMLMGSHQEVLLTDFGIAIVAQNTSIQQTQGVAGTAAYMAPEQLQGKPRPSSDLYSLGVVIYEWLCGERPFQGGPLEVISQHVLTPPPPLREKVPGIPAAIEQVVLTALAKDPKERFGNVRAFANAFQQACREAGMVYVTSAQPIVPPAPVSLPPPTLSQASTVISNAPAQPPDLSQASTVISNQPAQPGTPPGVQIDHPAASIFSATTHITPPLPPVLPPSSPSVGQMSQTGASLFSAPTPPTQPAPAQANTGTSPTLPPIASPNNAGEISSGAQERVAFSMPPAQGWAAPLPPTGPGASLLATSEAVYRAGGSGTGRVESALAGVPAAPGALLPGGDKGKRKGGWYRWVLLIASCVVLLALIGGAAAYELPRLLNGSSVSSTLAISATVTITPAKSDLSNMFNLTAVPGTTPDASKQQVAARMISVTTQANSTTVQATGQGTTPGTHATGTLKITNNTGAVIGGVTTGTTFTGTSGITVIADASTTNPFYPGTSQSLPAHASTVGSSGNIPALDINVMLTMQCHAGGCPQVTNPAAFTGGMDPSSYAVVQQSDINNAANSLISANQPNPQQVIQGQLQSNEQQVGTPQCTPNTSANHAAGDVANTVTVTVTFTCTGEAYDHAGALMLAAQLLMNQAASNPGAGYALVGQIKTNLVSAAADSQGAVAIVVGAEGIWVFQFSASQQQALASLIAGKRKQDAMSLLLAQPGVALASIRIAGGNGQMLPASAKAITITIQAVSGL